MFISRHCFIVHSTCYTACVWNIINVVDSLCLCHTEEGIINLNILQPVFCKCSHVSSCCIICLHNALFMNQSGFFASICFCRNIILTGTYISRNKSCPIVVLLLYYIFALRTKQLAWCLLIGLSVSAVFSILKLWMLSGISLNTVDAE